MAVLTVTSAKDGRGKDVPEGSLRQIISQAKSGDTIKFSSALKNKKIALDGNLSIEKDLVIDGSKAPGVTIDGRKKSVIFSVKGDGRSFSLRGVNLANAFHGYDGAAIRVIGSRAKIKVENSEFRNNTAGYGGAIRAKTFADVTVLNSKFYGNRSTIENDTSAGAISVFDRSKLTVKGSEFIANQGVTGGAIGTIFTELLVDDSVFKNNTSQKSSGAVHADGATIPAQQRYYKGDRPRATKGKPIVISDSEFQNNRSAGHGGAVGVWGYDQDFVTIESTKFIGNRINPNKTEGTARGGALRVSGKQVNIKDSQFISNSSGQEGGAIWQQGESPANISNTTFSNNSASKRGGAIYNRQWGGPGTTIEKSTFKGNNAADGDAIYKHNSRSLVLSRSQLQGKGTSAIGGKLGNLVIKNAGKGAIAPTQSTANKKTKTQPLSIAKLQPKDKLLAEPTTNKKSVNKSSDPFEGAVARFDFNEGKGNQADNSVANRNNPYALLRGGTGWTNGLAGKAVAFDGTGDAVTLGKTPEINQAIHDERTVDFWFKAEDVSVDSKKQVLYEEGGKDRGLNIYLHDDLLYVGGWNEPKGESGWDGTWLQSNKVVSNQWHHVALVLDGDQSVRPNALSAYIDGQKIAGQGKGSQLWAHSDSISLGSVRSGTQFHDGTQPSKGHSFAGAIDNLGVYNSALTAGQVKGLASR